MCVLVYMVDCVRCLYVYCMYCTVVREKVQCGGGSNTSVCCQDCAVVRYTAVAQLPLAAG